jgi:membrane-anchored glycerophosphoryl diester phosphodiesterase (GDPDase)
MKKQKMKNALLILLLMISSLIVFFAIASIVVIAAVAFQSTSPGTSLLEQIARFTIVNPVLSFVLTIMSVSILVVLKKPFEGFLRRNKIEKKLEEFFSDC